MNNTPKLISFRSDEGPYGSVEVTAIVEPSHTRLADTLATLGVRYSARTAIAIGLAILEGRGHVDIAIRRPRRPEEATPASVADRTQN